MNHPTEEQLILFHYGEDGEDGECQGVSGHLQNCEMCRANYHNLCQALLLVEATPVPQRDPGYGAQVWRELRPRLPAKPGSEAARWTVSSFIAGLAGIRLSRLSLAGGLALLVVASFLAGRFASQPRSTSAPPLVKTPVMPAPRATERVLLREISDHLERSQLALIELINTKTNGVVDLSFERELAQQLIGVNRLYRQAAARLGEVGSAQVLEELERALIEIANGPAQLSSTEFAEFRDRLDTHDLLFKVKVLGSQVRTKERETARELAANRS